MNIEGKKALVTGGAGFIGSHLVDLLVARGNDVTIVDDFSAGKEQNIEHHSGNRSVHVVRSDVCDLEAMMEVLKGADIIFHLAASCLRISLYNPERVHQVNATGSLHMCRAALHNGVERYVYVSSSESYGSANTVPMTEEHALNPTTIYGASKLAGEAYTQALWHTHGLPTVVVRPFNTYGPREHSEGPNAEVIPRFVLRVMAGSPPVIFGDGNQTRDFTWVHDTARGILLAAECDDLLGDCVNIARGEEVTVRELCNIVQTVLGREDLNPVHMHEGRPGDVYRHFADITKARRLLGFEPAVGIHEGVRRYVSWIGDQGIDVERWASQESVVNWEGE